MYYVYILQLGDESLYTGYTNNIQRRIDEHSNGRGSKYVKSRLPLSLEYTETYLNRKEAMRREIAIKKLSRKQKLRLIENYVKSVYP